MALVGLDGELFGVGLRLARFGADWQVESQSSPCGETSSNGAARPTTLAAYEALTAEG